MRMVVKFSKWVENNVGKGDIAHYKQFLPFLGCFQKACILQTHKNQGFFSTRLKLQLEKGA